ncbi:hypothetical protein D3C74_350100 [compost metagenome]
MYLIQIILFGAQAQMNCVLVIGIGPIAFRLMIDGFQQHNEIPPVRCRYNMYLVDLMDITFSTLMDKL